MPARTPLPAVRHPLRLLSGILLVTVAACTWLSFSVYDAYLRVEDSHRQLARHEHLRGEILRLDEALTMTATMAAASGEPRWDERYQRLASEFDAVLAETKRSTPVARAFAANVKLLNMEARAFALVRAGDLRAARAIFDEPEYLQQKKFCAEGVAESIEDSRAYLDESLRRERAAGVRAL
ncbi:MAG: hypothetical protein ACMG6S_20555, partial [Byssovorax sp.]